MNIVILDIETTAPPDGEEIIEQELECWEPPANIRDPQKIEARRIEASAKLREKLALTDAAPIICVGTAVENAAPVVRGEWESGGERYMLAWLTTVLDFASTIVTKGGGTFDLPKLRFRYLINGLPIPVALRVAHDASRYRNTAGVQHIDIGELWTNYYTVQAGNSLDAICQRLFGLPPQPVCGADIPALYQAGQYERIIEHCREDVERTRSLFRRLCLGAIS